MPVPPYKTNETGRRQAGARLSVVTPEGCLIAAQRTTALLFPLNRNSRCARKLLDANRLRSDRDSRTSLSARST